MRKIAFYDCEIAKCVPDRFYDDDPRYQYCQGWHDKAGMGVACIAVYANWSGYHVFLDSQLAEFQQLMAEADEVVGFNSIDFDDALLAANDINIKTTYDLLCETRVASGQPPNYVRGQTRGGYALEPMSQANLGKGKTGTGALAPELWQDGKYREVIEYCLNDIDLLRELYERRSHLIDPTNHKILLLRGGSRWKWLKTRAKRCRQTLASMYQESDLAIFLWAIVRSDIRECRLYFRPPIKLSAYWGRPITFSLTFQLPALRAWVPLSLRMEFEKQTGRDIDPMPF